jgi:hypothetical protein
MIWTDNGLKDEIKKLEKEIIESDATWCTKVQELESTIARIGNECADLTEENKAIRKKLEEKNNILRNFKEALNNITK